MRSRMTFKNWQTFITESLTKPAFYDIYLYMTRSVIETFMKQESYPGMSRIIEWQQQTLKQLETVQKFAKDEPGRMASACRCIAGMEGPSEDTAMILSQMDLYRMAVDMSAQYISRNGEMNDGIYIEGGELQRKATYDEEATNFLFTRYAGLYNSYEPITNKDILAEMKRRADLFESKHRNAAANAVKISEALLSIGLTKRQLRTRYPLAPMTGYGIEIDKIFSGMLLNEVKADAWIITTQPVDAQKELQKKLTLAERAIYDIVCNFYQTGNMDLTDEQICRAYFCLGSSGNIKSGHYLEWCRDRMDTLMDMKGNISYIDPVDGHGKHIESKFLAGLKVVDEVTGKTRYHFLENIPPLLLCVRDGKTRFSDKTFVAQLPQNGKSLRRQMINRALQYKIIDAIAGKHDTAELRLNDVMEMLATSYSSLTEREKRSVGAEMAEVVNENIKQHKLERVIHREREGRKVASIVMKLSDNHPDLE